MLFFNDPNKALNGKQTPRRSYLAAALSNKPIDSSSIMMKSNTARQSSETRSFTKIPSTKELITISNQHQTSNKVSLFPQSTKKETGLFNVQSQKNLEKVNSEAVPFHAKGRSSLHQQLIRSPLASPKARFIVKKDSNGKQVKKPSSIPASQSSSNIVTPKQRNFEKYLSNLQRNNKATQ